MKKLYESICKLMQMNDQSGSAISTHWIPCTDTKKRGCLL